MKYSSNIVIIVSLSPPPATKSSAGASFYCFYCSHISMAHCLASFTKERRQLVKTWLLYLKELISIYSLCFFKSYIPLAAQTDFTHSHSTLLLSAFLPLHFPCEWVGVSLQLPCIIKAAVEVYCSGAELQRHYRPLQCSCLTSDSVKHQRNRDPCFTHVFPQ